MRFYISGWNHSRRARAILPDIVLPIMAGLRDLGHEVAYGAGPPRRGVTNILIEHFRTDDEVARLRGLDYVLIGTELADGAGFNNRRTRIWRKRWENFVSLAPEARGIWVLCDGGAAGYQAVGPAVQISLGWSAALERPPSQSRPRYDLYAYGRLTTPERQAALARLGTRLRLVTTQYSSARRRDRLLRQARYCYGFRPPFHGVGYASTSRIVTSLMQGVPVLQETVSQRSPLVDALELVGGADDVLARWDDLVARRDEILKRQLEAWRAMPAATIMAPAVAALKPGRDNRPPDSVFRTWFAGLPLLGRLAR